MRGPACLKKFIYLLFCQGLKIKSYIFFGSSLCFIGILIVSSCVLITSCVYISISGAVISRILQLSCLFPDYEKSAQESAQESVLTRIENGWNNLAERGIINRDTAAVNHVDERKRCTAVRRDKTALFQRIAQEFVHRMYMEMFCSEFG